MQKSKHFSAISILILIKPLSAPFPTLALIKTGNNFHKKIVIEYYHTINYHHLLIIAVLQSINELLFSPQHQLLKVSRIPELTHA